MYIHETVRDCVCQVCGQQGLAPGLDQGGALGPADMVALAAAYPLLFIQVHHQLTLQSMCWLWSQPQYRFVSHDPSPARNLVELCTGACHACMEAIPFTGSLALL